MQLHIAPTRLLSEIQKEFNEIFPFLRIEFFQKNKLEKLRISLNRIAFHHSRNIGDCQSTITDGVLEFSADMKVCELEKMLKEQFHLNAGIFRQSGSLWLQTTMTDNWTLQKQNEHGMELSQSPETRMKRYDEHQNT